MISDVKKEAGSVRRQLAGDQSSFSEVTIKQKSPEGANYGKDQETFQVQGIASAKAVRREQACCAAEQRVLG